MREPSCRGRLVHRGLVVLDDERGVCRVSTPPPVSPDELDALERWVLEQVDQGIMVKLPMLEQLPVDEARQARLARFGLRPSRREQRLARLGALLVLLGVWSYGVSTMLAAGGVWLWHVELGLPWFVSASAEPWAIWMLVMTICSVLLGWAWLRLSRLRFGSHTGEVYQQLRARARPRGDVDLGAWPPKELPVDELVLTIGLFGGFYTGDPFRITLSDPGDEPDPDLARRCASTSTPCLASSPRSIPMDFTAWASMQRSSIR